MARFPLSDLHIKHFAAVYLLDYMVGENKMFDVLLQRDEADLEPILEHLLVHDCVQIRDGKQYRATMKGQQTVKRFLDRYREFLGVFDVFAAVDLGSGEFALASYFEVDQRSWKAYLADERWEDLRVPIAASKGIHPAEIVFLSFLQEKRFGRNEIGWQFDLLLGSVWDDILEVCETALHVDQLGYSDDQGTVTGDMVLHDVIAQGAGLMLELLAEERRQGGASGLAGPMARSMNGKPLRDPMPALQKLAEDPTFVSPEWQIAWSL